MERGQPLEIHAVILAGGSGTRFWPLSTRSLPKQLLALTGPNSMLAETEARVAPLVGIERVWAVCGEGHAEAVAAELRGLPPSHLLVEPMARNTAPAVALASRAIHEQSPEAVAVVLPADHHIEPVDVFQQQLAHAAEVAREGWIVTLGIAPTFPATGYGWIRAGGRLEGDCTEEVFQVDAFLEKPDREAAERLLKAGGHFWNAGIFVFPVDLMREELRRHAPAVAGALDVDDLWPKEGRMPDPGRLRAAYASIEGISIDYAVMEKTDRAAVLPARFQWSDVGSFDALAELLETDANGNVSIGDGVFVDAHRNVTAGEGTIAVLGLDDIVVVRRGDVVLVCPRSRSQDVRRVVSHLQRTGREDLL